MLTDAQIAKLRATKPSYKEDLFPPSTDGLFDDEIVGLVGEANREIGNLNSYARIIPSSRLLVWPLLLRESVASSKIEGTQASAKDVLETEAQVRKPENFQDVLEVANYRDATKLGWELIKEMPVCTRMMKMIHSKLLEGDVRGNTTRVGDFRQGQNAIAPEGNEDPERVRYIPPEPTKVSNLMGRLETYINDEKVVYDELIQSAIAHYEFEAIHPFADGNGRVGRVVIALQMKKDGVLKEPLLYPSAYLLRNKEEYDRRLLEITTKSDWSGWIKFFLRGMVDEALKSQSIIEKIDKLYCDAQERVRVNTKSAHAHKLVEEVFKRPIIRANQVQDLLGVEHATAMSLLRSFSELDILEADERVKKNIPFTNEKLIETLEVI